MTNSNKILSAGLLLLILVLINVLAGFTSWKLDLTDGHVYSLSKGSKGIINKLEEPVYLDFYYSRNAEDVRVIYKNFAGRVEALLKQYAAASDGMVQLNIINPQPDTEEEEAAIMAGIRQSTLPNGEAFFLGLAVSQAGQEVIPLFDLNKEAFLEYDISKAIYSVQLFKKPTLGLVTSLPMIAEPQQFNPMMPQQQQAQSWVIIEQLRQFYDIVEIKTPEDMPEHLDTLAVIHPSGLGDDMLFAIDQAILKGIPAFVAVDPSSFLLQGQQQQMQMMGAQPQNTSSDLPQLFKAWGIQYDPSQVLADPAHATMIQDNTRRQYAHPAYLSFSAEDIQADDVFFAGLDSFLLAEAGGFSYQSDSDLATWRPLITCSPDTGSIFSMILPQLQPSGIYAQITPLDSIPTPAGILSGKLKTAFPQGAPAPATNEGEDVANPAPASSALLESANSSTVILFADTDWLADMFSVQEMFSGVYYPINGNLALASNIIEYLSGNQDLISIRGKGSIMRPFDRVDAIERNAQARLQRKYEEVNQQVADLENNLQQLQTEQEQSNSLVITPEMQQRIDDFRHQLALKKGEQREIRKAMREEVENLGTFLAGINVILVPLIIAILGTIYFYRRFTRK